MAADVDIPNTFGHNLLKIFSLAQSSEAEATSSTSSNNMHASCTISKE